MMTLPGLMVTPFTEILGASSDPWLHDRLHQLEHRAGLDELRLSRADLLRRRLRAHTTAGREVAIALPRETPLFDGAVLELREDHALVVRVEAEEWLRLIPRDSSVALRLGYHAGNLHWRVRFDGPALLIAVENEIARYMDRLGHFLDSGEARCAGTETLADGAEA